VRFLRQAALLLPSAFLLGVLVFLLTHGRQDPGYAAYPFFQEWAGDRAFASSPEARFLGQALTFFLPAYLVTLFFLLAIALGERALFGPRKARRPGGFGQAFAATYPVVFLLSSVVAMWIGEKAALRQAPGALVAPLMAAIAPFAGAVLAALPAVVLAGPIALLRKLAPA
jgi:hypothetical protein